RIALTVCRRPRRRRPAPPRQAEVARRATRAGVLPRRCRRRAADRAGRGWRRAHSGAGVAPSVAGARWPRALKIGAPGLALLVAGGALYSIAAIIYARRSPDPVPHIFGHHELFQLLTLAAAGCHDTAIAFSVPPPPNAPLTPIVGNVRRWRLER